MSELVSVCNRSRASSEQVARRFGIPHVYDTWQELIAAPDTESVARSMAQGRSVALPLALD